MNRKEGPSKSKPTSWEPVAKWYNQIVGEEGHYYHKHVIIPGVQKLLNLDNKQDLSLLDLACGQGILARHIPENVSYTGVDISPSLIQAAKKSDKNPHHEYITADISKKLPVGTKKFTHAAIILALQNIEHGDKVISNIAKAMQENGQFLIVLNHPCFRIPRQSMWGIDSEKKIQYRRIDRYATDMKIPMAAQPSKGKESATTWTFHHSLSTYSRWLYESGFQVTLIEEWYSNKVSTGKNAKMENRSREEIPLFMAILANYC